VVPACHKLWASNVHQIGGKSSSSNSNRTRTDIIVTAAFHTYGCCRWTRYDHSSHIAALVSPNTRTSCSSYISVNLIYYFHPCGGYGKATENDAVIIYFTSLHHSLTSTASLLGRLQWCKLLWWACTNHFLHHLLRQNRHWFWSFFDRFSHFCTAANPFLHPQKPKMPLMGGSGPTQSNTPLLLVLTWPTNTNSILIKSAVFPEFMDFTSGQNDYVTRSLRMGRLHYTVV